ncbi:MAG: RluA family pseudouridine synthase [Phycisphaerales bacterium]|nr:RluA family pseudouridine synthase [Phycisphaerales bacterium]
MANYSVEPNDKVVFRIAYQDEHLLVVDKPTKIVSTPGVGHERSSLLSGLFAAFGNELQNLGKDRDFGMLHRLDRETSGLLIVGRRKSSYDALRALFEAREIKKFYLALVANAPRQQSGVIRKPIAETRAGSIPKNGEMKLAKLSGNGKPAVTAYRVLAKGPAASLLECRAVTGRLHQLRVHLESIGCPIFGDDLYAPPPVAAGAARLALHAHRVAFTHPMTGEGVDIRSPLPKDLRHVAKRFSIDLGSLADQPDGF